MYLKITTGSFSNWTCLVEKAFENGINKYLDNKWVWNDQLSSVV